MQLYLHELGTGPPLMIVHGLFGHGENWRSPARKLGERFRVILPDLRNHGDSPWSATMSITEMAQDLFDTADALGLGPVRLLGHSLGGKVAMAAALRDPERVEALVVADMAPRSYQPSHQEILRGMQAVAERGVGSRREADELLSEHVPHQLVRGFLLKSLRQDRDGRYRWKINLQAIQSEYRDLLGWPLGDREYGRAVLFLGGKESDYLVRERDQEAIRIQFPNASIETISKAGHWLHVEQPQAFLERLNAFFG